MISAGIGSNDVKYSGRSSHKVITMDRGGDKLMTMERWSYRVVAPEMTLMLEHSHVKL